MNFTKTLILIIFIFLTTNFSQAVSSGLDNTSFSLVSCIHQELDSTKEGISYEPAYRYAQVMQGESCPPFSSADEVPWNIVSEVGITWGAVAIPLGIEKHHSPTDHSCRFGQGGGGDPFL